MHIGRLSIPKPPRIPSRARLAGGLPLFSLLFPSNISGSDTTAPFVALQFDAPQSNGLPLWGPSGQGTTWIWRIKPLQQTGYYVTFWWSQGNGSIDSTTGYYGGHPYPQNSSNSGTTHYWEIATFASDHVNNKSGSPIPVVKDVWYTQALRVTRTSANSKTMTFYTNLPSTANADVIEWVETGTNYGESDPASPKVTIGDSPWYAGFQHERLSGYLSHFAIFSKVLSQADMLTEAAALVANNPLQTSDGLANIWWGKKGFASIDSLNCDYGTGRSFAWANSNKAALGSLT